MSGNSVFTLQHPSKILFDLSRLVGKARCTYVQEVKIQLLKIIRYDLISHFEEVKQSYVKRCNLQERDHSII